MRKAIFLDEAISKQLTEGRIAYEGLKIPYVAVSERSSQELKKETQEIITTIRQKKLPFPLTRYWFEFDRVKECYERLRMQKPEWIEREHETLKGHPGTLWLPTRFRGWGLQLLTQTGDWWDIDIIVDYFTEYERIRCRKDYNKSLAAEWQDDAILCRALWTCKGEGEVTCRTLREGMFMVCRELALFRASRAKHLVEIILNNEHRMGKRWLDLSAGWGDRLLAACALEMDYLGFDPNDRLRFGHTEMISAFGSGDKQRVIYRPFESPESQLALQNDRRRRGWFDICLTSPPFFTIERYEGEGQSTENYPDFNDWLVNFLFKSISIIWENLNPQGGYLAINIANIRGCDMVGPMLLFVRDYCPGASWEGILTFSGRGTQDTPAAVYVWKKLSDSNEVNLPEGKVETLGTSYPLLDRLWNSLQL